MKKKIKKITFKQWYTKYFTNPKYGEVVNYPPKMLKVARQWFNLGRRSAQYELKKSA